MLSSTKRLNSLYEVEEIEEPPKGEGENGQGALLRGEKHYRKELQKDEEPLNCKVYTPCGTSLMRRSGPMPSAALSLYYLEPLVEGSCQKIPENEP